MHEFSVARSLLTQINQIAAEYGGGTIQEVVVRCGPLAGIEPMLLAEAFDLLRVASECPKARLRIEQEPLEVDCRGCGTLFSPHQFQFVCPNCGSGDTVISKGDRLMIDYITLDQPLQEHVG